ncbi:MAG: SIR2 family protein [Candidatus Thiodiazotropha endolucinida]
MPTDQADRNLLVRELTKELKEENLAVFAGAGLSAPAGFVSWTELLRPVAEELRLDVDKEVDDLVSLAQYYTNENIGNRGRLNQMLIDEFCRDEEITENHKVLARLPINTYWTTNYDKLIESSLTEVKKVPDVKYEKRQLLFTRPRRDAIVYKMHGDVDHPGDAVLIKDDYEKYHMDRQPFMDALRGDLISKTFIFLGFSFTDPNLDYILSRVRVSYNQDQRQHYCILRAVFKEEDETDADYEYRQRKQELFVQDLRRVGVKTLLVDEYSEITDILKDVERQYRRNTIFISGAAHDYSPYDEEAVNNFVYELSQDIVKSGLKIVSGFGLGIGSSVISGALNQIYMSGGTLANDQLVMRPFPQPQPGQEDMGKLWEVYRKDMISRSGIALFLFGNKLEGDKVVASNGMRSEFEIAKENGLFLIPVGKTGYVAKELWDEVKEKFDDLYPNLEPRIKDQFMLLGNDVHDLSQLRTDLMSLLAMLAK